MSNDVKTDGVRLWARVEWQTTGGQTIDPQKIMLVDTGAPGSSISLSNIAAVPPGLTLDGIVQGVGAGGVTGDAAVIGGGQFVADFNGDGIKEVCPVPVLYMPWVQIDILGLDQIGNLGLIPWLYGQTFHGFGLPYWIVGHGLSLTPARIYHWFDPTYGRMAIPPDYQTETPTPGLFSYIGLPVPRGGISAPDEWDYLGNWPVQIPPGMVFQMRMTFTAREPHPFAVITQVLPYGFSLVSGDLSTVIAPVEPWVTYEIPLMVEASPAPGDHFFQSVVRVMDGAEEMVREMSTAIAVRLPG